jgi:hypothetical protein
MKKRMVRAAGARGYVLGARAGRQRYDQIMGLVNGIKNNPRVQATAHQAMDTAKEQAPVVADKVTQVATAAASKVTGHSPSNGRHHMAGPQGDLP